MDKEQWLDVVGYEGYYQVSSHGKARSLPRVVERQWASGLISHSKRPGFCLVPTDNGRGYQQVDLRVDCKRKQHKVHRLVATAFCPNPEGYEEVNHIDGDKYNNHFTNLEWCNRSQNIQHAYDLGLRLTIKEYRES